MEQYLLSLGSNIGNKTKNLNDALKNLKNQAVSIVSSSSFYATAPLLYLSQDDFVNMCAIVETDLKPIELLDTCKDIENKMGRVKVVDKGPRIIDLDIIFWDKSYFSSETLDIPHKSWRERLFVMVPAKELIDKTGCFAEFAGEIENSLKKMNYPAEKNGIRLLEK